MFTSNITKFKFYLYTGKFNIIFQIICSMLCYLIFFKINAVHAEEVLKGSYLTRIQYQEFFCSLSEEERVFFIANAKKAFQLTFERNIYQKDSLDYTINILDTAFVSNETIKAFCMDKRTKMDLIDDLYNMAKLVVKYKNKGQSVPLLYEPETIHKLCIIAIGIVGAASAIVLILNYFKLI